MALSDELLVAAERAAAHAGPGERVTGLLAAEPTPGRRIYVCTFEGAGEARTWLALDGDGAVVSERRAVREAVSIAAICELAEESAGGGRLDELRSQLVAVRITQDLPGLENAEAALDALERVIGAPPQLATPARLDEIGVATRRLEIALGEAAVSPFGEAMKAAAPVVDALLRDVEAAYRAELR